MIDRPVQQLPKTELAPLREDIDRYDRAAGLDFDAFMDSVREEEEARGPLRRWLDALSTRQRRQVAAAVTTLVGGAILWHMGLRGDLAEHWQKVGVMFSVMLGLVYLSMRMSLRDPAAAPPGRWAWAVAGVGLALIAALPVLSSWLPGESLALGPFWTLRCFRFTLLIGGVTAGALLALQRPGLSGLWRALNAGLAGATAGAFFLMLHCTIIDADHLWAGHTMPGLAVALGALGLGMALRLLRR